MGNSGFPETFRNAFLKLSHAAQFTYSWFIPFLLFYCVTYQSVSGLNMINLVNKFIKKDINVSVINPIYSRSSRKTEYVETWKISKRHKFHFYI